MVAMNIKGNVSGFEGKFIRLYQVSDYISYKEVKLDVVKIDDKGDFELNAYLTKPALLKLKVDNISLDILALPEFKPEVILTYDEELNSTRVYDKQFNVEFLNNSDAGLNGLIFEYQRIYSLGILK